MNMSLILGIDTSCYTTSLALMTKQGKLEYKVELPLEVELGKGGLRQSEGVFQHVNKISYGLKKFHLILKLI